MSSFPYAMTQAAVDHTYSLTNGYGNLYVIHQDNGIPWYEALNELPYPREVRDTWNRICAKRPNGVPVYLGLAPLGEDRVTPARASKDSAKPDLFKECRLDDPQLVKAYTNYVLMAVDTFDPDFLNLGIEAGALAMREPSEWPHFERLFFAVRADVKKKHPSIKIAISFELPVLMSPKVQERVAGVIEASDYIGISFYPFMSPFYKRFGADALPEPPDAWRAPLSFLSKFSAKPIAICETGYSSRDVNIAAHRLRLEGDAALQEQYLRELADYARRDNYLFVVWFLAVDYDRLFESIPEGDGSHRIWQHTGFFNADLEPKPAWKTWKSIVASAQLSPEISEPASPPGIYSLNFGHSEVPFSCSPNDSVHVASAGDSVPRHMTEGKVLEWDMVYRKGEWNWIAAPLNPNQIADCNTLKVAVRSSQEGAVLLQLEERDGEAFFMVLQPELQWNEISTPLANLQVSPDKERNGKLEPAKLVKIVFADSAAAIEGNSGTRSIHIGRVAFL